MKYFRNKTIVQIFIQMFSILQTFLYEKNILHQKNVSVYYTFLYIAPGGLFLDRIFLFLTKCVHYCLLEDKVGNMVVLNTYFFTTVNPF